MAGTKGRSGRARKSIEQRKLEGSFRADRHSAAIVADGSPTKPEYLDGEASELWDAITPKLVKLGIATEVDSQTLAALCEWWQAYRDAADQRRYEESGLTALAAAINNLAGTLFLNGGDAAVDLAEMVLAEVGELIDRVGKDRRARVASMKTAWVEFSRIAARFGMTPMDRRAMKDVEGGPAKDDPIAEFLARRRCQE